MAVSATARYSRPEVVTSKTEIVQAEPPAISAAGSIRVIGVIGVRQWQFRCFRKPHDRAATRANKERHGFLAPLGMTGDAFVRGAPLPDSGHFASLDRVAKNGITRTRTIG